MSNKNIFTDIHCHSLIRGFNSGEDIWIVNSIDDKNDERLKTIFRLPQAGFSSLAKGRTRLIFLSLYPVEQGFLTNLVDSVFNPDTFLGSLADALISTIIKDSEMVRFEAAKYVLNLSKQRFEEISNPNHDYFTKDIQQEYEFLSSKASVKRKVLVNGVEKDFQIKIMKDFNDVKHTLGIDDDFNYTSTADNTIGIVLTIEGGHALGCGQQSTLSLTDDQLIPILKNNIARLKQWGGGDHCPFFITITHHFWNQLCGHAMSMAKIMHTIFDQNTGMNQGITPAGQFAVKELLSNENGQRRILIDIKHMSKEGRTWYFNFVAEHNRNNPNDIIPLIASHVGFNGIQQLDITKTFSDHKLGDDWYSQSEIFNNWDINLSDEELKLIYSTGGIIGLIMDQRILSGQKMIDSVTRIAKADPINDPAEYANWILFQSIWAEPVVQHIIHLVKLLGDGAWDMITLGSDFDGLINPLDAFAYSDDFPSLRAILIEKLKLRAEVDEVLANKDFSELVDKMFYKNSLKFLQKNYK